ncbi:hypothetical protein CDD82_7794 [Ophiocordyceps australis]|uniref:Uncharacterized protein n=1 Tax=Ophiocordyceps australis TaxID=1399860 RepID=A0A2C5Y1P2_9HYPO|nr:hypothetical protein CDD82_7794 [Ophiocordyceps australis]
MGQSFLDRIQAKLELFRLEQRYTRHRNRRSTFVSKAVYVDGEYVYQTPSSTGSSTDSKTARVDALHGQRPAAAATPSSTGVGPSNTNSTHATVAVPPPGHKRLSRFSSMPGFGSSFGKDRAQVVQRRTSFLS